MPILNLKNENVDLGLKNEHNHEEVKSFAKLVKILI